jgi:hypothetical protein
VTFFGGETSKTITITTQTDVLTEGSEFFKVSIREGSALTVALDTARVGTPSQNGTIEDNVLPPTFSLSPAVTTFEEGNSQLMTVTLSHAYTAAIVIDYSTVGTSGKANAADFTGGLLPSGSLTFPAGTVSKTFTLSTLADICVGADDPTDIFSTTITLNSGSATAGSNTTHTLNLTDFSGGC